MPTAKLTSRPEIAKIKNPASGTDFYSHDGDALKGIRLAVGARSKTWIMSKRINGKVRSIKLGDWPAIAHGDAAAEIAKVKIKELEAGTDAQSTSITTLGDAFESHIERSSAKPSTIETYRIQVRTHLSDIFEKPIEKVTLPMLERRLSELAKAGKVSTAHHVCAIIKMASRRASIVRRMFDVAADLRVGVKANVGVEVSFDTDEKWPALDAILEIKSLYRRTAWLLMLFTGLRAINVRELRWENVDLRKKTIRVDGLKNGETRVFPVADAVIAALSTLPLREGWVFPAESKTGHVVDLGELSRGTEMHQGQERKKKLLGQHDCRRLFTTAARREKLPSYIIDQLRGDTIKSVQDRYDQGSANHDDANMIAARIIMECGFAPDLLVERIKSPDYVR